MIQITESTGTHFMFFKYKMHFGAFLINIIWSMNFKTDKHVSTDTFLINITKRELEKYE